MAAKIGYSKEMLAQALEGHFKDVSLELRVKAGGFSDVGGILTSTPATVESARKALSEQKRSSAETPSVPIMPSHAEAPMASPLKMLRIFSVFREKEAAKPVSTPSPGQKPTSSGK